MIEFFGNKKKVYVVQSTSKLQTFDLDKLYWLFNNESKIEVSEIKEFLCQDLRWCHPGVLMLLKLPE